MNTNDNASSLLSQGRALLLLSIVQLLSLSIVCDERNGISEDETEDREEMCYRAILYLHPLLKDASEEALRSVLLRTDFFTKKETGRLLGILRPLASDEDWKRKVIELLRTYYDIEEIIVGIENYGQAFYQVEENGKEDFRTPVSELTDKEMNVELETLAGRCPDDDEDIRKFKNAVRRWMKKN